MASILADSYDVISAGNLEEALFFLHRSPPCRLAYVEIGPKIDISINNIRVLRKLGMDIVALFRSPCPQLVRDAIKAGRIQGLFKIPININLFPRHVHKLVSAGFDKYNVYYYKPSILTTEEVDYILNFEPEDV